MERGTYGSWQKMLGRCHNKNQRCWKNYGGRGITIEDPRWYEYENFLADMGERPPGMTIERKDNERGYCKDNCKWATRKENNNNRRVTIFVTYRGERLPLSEVVERIGISIQVLWYRLKVAGWTEEEAFETPPDPVDSFARIATLTPGAVREIRESTEPARVMAEKFGVSRCTIYAVRQRRVWRHVA